MAEELSHEEKITEIMRLSGVPPRDYDHCRPNTEKIYGNDPDVKLVELRKREERLRQWRES